MATIKDLIKSYITETDKLTDNQQAVNFVISKINKLTKYASGETIPKSDKIKALLKIKNAANDEHLTLITQIMEELEKSEE